MPEHHRVAGMKERAAAGAALGAFVAIIALSYGGMMSNFVRWILLPTILVSIAGALGGMAFAVTDPLRRSGGWRRTFANALSGLFYALVVCAAFLAALNRPR